MDETEKYKQRLEAIAEKRRLQEEQDRAKRDMEDEKLRLQQLKRKSLRDQWLMEGAPLSPTSLDAQSPRSPLWGSQAQEIEKHIDKLQSESQRLPEEEEKLREQMEDGQAEAVKVAEAGAEIVHDAVVQNGEHNATGLETPEDEMKINPLLDETAAVITNGRGDFKADTNQATPEESIQDTTNGSVVASEGVVSMTLEPELGMAASEAEPVEVSNVDLHEEEEEGGMLVMRAERVIITDEGDEEPEDLTHQENQQEAVQSEETPLPNQEADKEGEEAVEEVVKTETAPEAFPQPEESEAAELTAEAQPATGDGDVQNENRDGDTKREGQDQQLDGPTSVHVQSPADALEGTTVAPVPVYSEVQPSALIPNLEAEREASASPEGAEAALKDQDPATLPGQFQEVPLADPQEKQRTEAGPGEQEPLLSQNKAPDTQAEPEAVAAGKNPASTETHSPTRASQGEQQTEAPKHKTCQCCSVM